MNTQFQTDLEKLIQLLPPKIAWDLREKNLSEMIEIVLDLGRYPEIRYLDKRIEYFGNETISQLHINHIVEQIDDFTSDNRSGIPGTLHRISAIKNRKGTIIGLTCRVGRVVTGTISCIRDIVLREKSILFLGKPGVGKTTKLREIARLLADELGKRVIVVDTSNEIAGDGDVPHCAIGRARRMQVTSPEKQKDVMIEAVENHTPEIVVVDEIGTELEAQAARTIAERGVMLVATAHGNTLENLIKNPTLSDLVGGITAVTIGDDEARRRSTQKTVLERKKQPTFDILIEIIDKNTLAIYQNVSEAVDYILRGYPIKPETRTVDQTAPEFIPETIVPIESKEPLFSEMDFGFALDKYSKDYKQIKKIYIYAVSRSIVDKVIERLELKAEVTRNIDEADFVITHKSYAKGGAKILNVAENYELPIYVVKSNTMPHIQKAIKSALNLADQPGDEVFAAYFDETEEALTEATSAVNKVINMEVEIELEPRPQRLRKLQHELVDQYELESISVGDEPNRRLKILPATKNLKHAG